MLIFPTSFFFNSLSHNSPFSNFQFTDHFAPQKSCLIPILISIFILYFRKIIKIFGPPLFLRHFSAVLGDAAPSKSY
jgi:hypothetical protein